MKLIDVVKDSLDANGIAYDQQLKPDDVLIAYPVIKKQELPCAISAIDTDKIICLEYYLDDNIEDDHIYEELMQFIIRANNNLSIGSLSFDYDNDVVIFKNGIHMDYIGNPQVSIARFIQKTGEEAVRLMFHIHSIAIGKSTCEGEFDLFSLLRTEN